MLCIQQYICDYLQFCHKLCKMCLADDFSVFIMCNKKYENQFV